MDPTNRPGRQGVAPKLILMWSMVASRARLQARLDSAYSARLASRSRNGLDTTFREYAIARDIHPHSGENLGYRLGSFSACRSELRTIEPASTRPRCDLGGYRHARSAAHAHIAAHQAPR